MCKGILPFVKTYATKCSSYYRDVIVCSCLIEAEEAGGKEYKKSIREWFLSVYISYKSDQIKKYIVLYIVSLEIDCVRYCVFTAVPLTL